MVWAGWGVSDVVFEAPRELDGAQSTRAVSRQRTWWHQGDLGGNP